MIKNKEGDMRTPYSLSNLKKCISVYIFVAFTLLSLTACQLAPLHVQSVLENDADPRQYQSVSVESLNLKNDVISMITKGIEQHLQSKGYVLSDEPELVFVYQLDIKESEHLNYRVQTEGRHVLNLTSLEAVFEAKMLVNAIDTRNKQLIWKASTSKDIRSVDKDSVDQGKINTRMEELFASFPAR
jgi:hypothetical protein